MTVDLTTCDHEPIHLLGHVQTFGCLIAVSSDWIILHASRNTGDHLGLDAEGLVGRALRGLISDSAIHSIRSRLQLLSGENAIERLYGIYLFDGDDRRFNIAVHVSGRAFVLEFEPYSEDEDRRDYLASVRTMVDRIGSGRTVEEICNASARFVKALTGFDRVMVYRFRHDDTGEVLAEAATSGIGSFLGLRYPASDIPAQARELYRRSLLRIIADVDDKVSEIIPPANPQNQLLDLSLSGLRAVSPIHLEYLRNMDVKASMSISILQNGKLWGLFACHHYSPRVLNYSVRTACDLFGQMFSFVLERVESQRKSADAERARGLHDRLMRQLAEGSRIGEDFDSIVDGLADLIPFDGAAGWIEGEYHAIGQTPTEAEFMPLVRILNTGETSRVYSVDCIADVHPPAAGWVERGAGLLALPVSRTPRDYIVLFRQEVSKTVNWAGNPQKPAELGPNGIRLTPRKSFEAWQETVRGCSSDWTASEIEVAEAIRVTLLEVVLRMADAANLDRLRAHERQELLIAELNHRVRNILNLIRGLVDQSRSEAATVAEFTETVSGRIHALARAHDQITSTAWEAASLRNLIETEVRAYLGDKADRVHFSGVDAIIKPEAFATLALVLHEMTTNSAKYGALSDNAGQLRIHLAQERDGALQIDWEEMDGPPVKAPLRRGFGSTIIEGSIPFELGGQAEVHYPIAGVKGRFLIPGRHIERFETPDGDPAEQGEGTMPAVNDQTKPTFGKALLVEDNLIIALDGEMHLRSAGAEDVLVASTVKEGLRLIDEFEPDFAVLDLNLGHETSLPVARRLAEKGIPFAFATGYGDASNLSEEFSTAPVVTKPYGAASLATALDKLFSSGG